MKSNLVALGLLAGALISSHSTSSEAAAERVKYRGENAQLALFQQTEITCEDGSAGLLGTSLSLQLFSDEVRGTLGNSDTQSLLLFFSEHSSCTGSTRDFVAFEEPESYNQQRVNSASFAHSFDMVDVFTGDPIGTLTLDVELSGFGPTNRVNTHTTTRSGDFTFRSHVNGVSREATASGSVDLDGEELIHSAPSASLSDMHSAETTITR